MSQSVRIGLVVTMICILIAVAVDLHQRGSYRLLGDGPTTGTDLSEDMPVREPMFGDG